VSVLAWYFGLPSGQVWPNLLASLVCAGVVWWRLHQQAATQHAVMLAQAAAHHLEQLAQAEADHLALREHVTAAAASRAAARKPKTLVTKPAEGAGADGS
jgi:hypothetical protein